MFMSYMRDAVDAMVFFLPREWIGKEERRKGFRIKGLKGGETPSAVRFSRSYAISLIHVGVMWALRGRVALNKSHVH